MAKTKEEMLEAIAQVQLEAKDELRVIKRGTWPKERLPIIEKRLVMLDAVRSLIENFFEWQERAERMEGATKQFNPAWATQEWADLLKEIRDFGKEEK